MAMDRLPISAGKADAKAARPAPASALAHPCASVAEFDERLWGAMVDYVTVGVDVGMTVVFRDGDLKKATVP